MEKKTTSLRAKLLLAILSPIVFLGVLELLLQLLGTGHKTDFTIIKEFDGKDYYITNPDFTKPWFPGQNPRLPYPFGIPVEKSSDSLRVLVMGASAAQGDPKPEFGFSRMLDRMLTGQFEDRKVEVYNLGITAINSHVVKEIARDAQKFKADYWIVYLGNNEVIGPHGPANPGLQTPGLRTTLLKTKTGQALSRLLKGNKDSLQWQGMESYLKPIKWDSPELEKVYENFEANLSEIVEHGKSSGAKILLSTVAVNLRTCSPLNPEDEALNAWEGKEYANARDLDTYRFRADSRINKHITSVAKRTDSTLLDASNEFENRESASVKPLFVDHVHFTLHGNNILALMLGQKILDLEEQDIQPPKVNPTIGFNNFDKQGILKIMRGRLSRPPFLKQQADGLSLKNLSADIQSLNIKSNEDLQEIEQVYLTAINAHPSDAILRLNYATFLLSFNQSEVAKTHCRKAIVLAPWNPAAYYNLALSHAATNSPLSAKDNLEKALQISPQYSRAHALLGTLLAKSDPKKALHHFNESVRIEPDDPQALISLAEFLLKKEKSSDHERAYELSLHACVVSQFSNPQAVLVMVSSAKKCSKNKEAISRIEDAVDKSSDLTQQEALRKIIKELK